MKKKDTERSESKPAVEAVEKQATRKWKRAGSKNREMICMLRQILQTLEQIHGSR